MPDRALRTINSSPRLWTLAAAIALLLPWASAVRAQSVDFDPAALTKQRNAILLKAAHNTPLADLENDVNHLAVLSETCRAESGAKACGLSEKALATTSLEDRYAYYVRMPVAAHASGHQPKVNRHNWEAPAPATASR